MQMLLALLLAKDVFAAGVRLGRHAARQSVARWGIRDFLRLVGLLGGRHWRPARREGAAGPASDRSRIKRSINAPSILRRFSQSPQATRA